MKKIHLIILTIFTLVSCSQKPGEKSIINKIIAGDYFSMRQQTPTTTIGIIQLKLPALLKNAAIIDGVAQIDPEAKQAVIDEQDEVITKLQALSSDIKIINRYKLVLNAIAYVAPSELSDKIEKIDGVVKRLDNTNFDRPKIMSALDKSNAINRDLNTYNTINFIGANKLHALGVNGQNMKVGIIDTGIDYTHRMFGGPGTPEAYKSIDPNENNNFFPNEKVVGGKDFVGSKFNTGSSDIEAHIPHPDNNPIDEAEHGTHVSGTVAGIGDGINTYSGVAPLAKLYALKVFGKTGSTSDIAVIAALEYAADISESIDPSKHLDVVNLSLGGGYGKPKILYSEAVYNLTRAGTVVVASAGNAGDEPYIVGAPSTADDAISIAATIDDLPQNIMNDAIEFQINGVSKITEVTEGLFTIPAHKSNVAGTLVYIGNGASPITDEVKAKVKGRVALIDRGMINFEEKLNLARDLGAIGVIVANNQPGPAIQMGGDGKFEFPAVMITLELGDEIKKAMNSSEVNINFSTDKIIRHDEKIDLITDFSSRGPRSLDSLIKPEIAAPGENIISAKCGSGNEGVQFSGTSMASPHMAGVMTLLKQGFPKLTVAELKAKVMTTSKILMRDGNYVPVSLQGAGRVQVDSAYKSKVVATPSSFSLGEVPVASMKSVAREITLKNTSNEDVVFTSKVMKGKNIDVSLPASFKVKANSIAKINVSFTFKRINVDSNNIESDGFIILKSATDETLHFPFLGILNKVSEIKTTNFVTMTDTNADKVGAEVQLTLTNNGKNDGDALLFNYLGKSPRKAPRDVNNLASDTSCDLEAAGIRIVEREVKGQTIKMLQIGVKLYDSLTMWQPCDISLQIDSNGDGIADQELVGIRANYISGMSGNKIVSLLLDASVARDIRKTYESNIKTATEDYTEAILDIQEMKFYDHASVAVIEADLSKINTGKNGTVGIKLAVSNLESENSSGDDFLNDHETKWQKINLKEEAFAYGNIPDVVTVKAQDLEKISLKRQFGSEPLLVLYPHNVPVGVIGHDAEKQILFEKLLKP